MNDEIHEMMTDDEEIVIFPSRKLLYHYYVNLENSATKETIYHCRAMTINEGIKSMYEFLTERKRKGEEERENNKNKYE